LTLGKYGVDVDFTGAVGEDENGKKIREVFDSYQVKTQYLETIFTEKSSVAYKIYNSKSNKFTSINEISNKLSLTKYKYEFIPDVVIMDDKDYNANLAALNNYSNSLFIYVGEKFTKESSVYCNKCNYVISTLSFASAATGVVNNLNKSKGIVELFQKYIDLYNSNLIVKLDNFDLLYCVDDEVRLIKNVNKNISNKDYVYYAVLIYFLINKYDIENAIKLTNKVMLSSKNEINLVDDIPDYSVVVNVVEEFKNVQAQNNIVLNQNSNQVVIDNNQNVQSIQNNIGINTIQTTQNINQNQANQSNIENNNQNIQNISQPNVTQSLNQNITQNQVNQSVNNNVVQQNNVNQNINNGVNNG